MVINALKRCPNISRTSDNNNVHQETEKNSGGVGVYTSNYGIVPEYGRTYKRGETMVEILVPGGTTKAIE